MKTKSRRKSHDRQPKPIRLRAVNEAGILALVSPTAVAAEALRTGVLPVRVLARRQSIPRGDDTMLMGDPDDRSLENEYVGEETPGGNNPTPDQSVVDEIGRAYGLQDEDSSGSLRSAAEVLGRRDRHRTELQPPRKPRA